MEEWKVEWLGQPTVFIHQQKPLGAHKKSNNEKKRGGRNILCNSTDLTREKSVCIYPLPLPKNPGGGVKQSENCSQQGDKCWMGVWPQCVIFLIINIFSFTAPKALHAFSRQH